MRYVPAFILDALLVLVFAAIGRASHSEDPLGFLATAWPFLVALLVGHVLAALLPARPRQPWGLAWGAIVWVATVAGGMLLRIATGDTAQFAFIIVATLTLGVFLLGWRAAALLVRRRRGAERAPAARTGADTGTAVGGVNDDRGASPRERDADAERSADDRAQHDDGWPGGGDSSSAGSDVGGGSDSGGGGSDSGGGSSD